MTVPSRMAWALLATTVVTVSPALAQGAPPAGVARNTSEMTFVNFPGMPTCGTGAVQSGDPGTGGSIIFAKLAAGCVFPWHWHTPTETLMIVSGTAHAQMKDGTPVVLRAGGFAVMPSKHVHQFRCSTACTLFVHSDAAFDMHYVDAQGNELSPADALKPVKETAAVPGK
jgi:quercetin dioxygenase-like cupin family protein